MSSRARKVRHSGSRRRSRSRLPGGATLWEILGVVLGIIVIVLGISYVIGAYYLTGVLGEIAQKDFTPANQRLSSYEDFFTRLERQGLEVAKSPPYIREGVKYFLWTVTVPDERVRLIYRWKHDLETNRVSPLTSPSTYLDMELGYIRRQEVGLYPYESGDELAMKLAKGTYRPTRRTVEESAAEQPEEQASQEQPQDSSGEQDAIEVGDGEAGGGSGGEAVDVGGGSSAAESGSGAESEAGAAGPGQDEGTGDGGGPPAEGEGIPIS